VKHNRFVLEMEIWDGRDWNDYFKSKSSEFRTPQKISRLLLVLCPNHKRTATVYDIVYIVCQINNDSDQLA